MAEFRKNIIVVAYSISPIRGSEYSVGWNYVLEMSRLHNITVFYGLAGDHMGDFEEISNAAPDVLPDGVKFVPVPPGRLARIFNWSNRRGFLVYGFYLAYRFWHMQLRRVLEQHLISTRYDLIHYLCPTGYREPGYLNGLGLPVVWGPVGGVDNQPLRLAFHLGVKAGIKSFFKTVINKFQFICDLRVRRGFNKATVLVSSTAYAQQQLRIHHGVETALLPENGILSSDFSRQRLVRLADDEILNIVWVGSIDSRKALIILLEALALIRDLDWTLHVVGTGALEKNARQFVDRNGLRERVNFHGKIPRSSVWDIFSKSHLHVITSLAEGNPTTLWEAMASGVPTLSLDHCGMATTICAKCGVKVPIDKPSNLIINIAAEISSILARRESIEKLSRGVAGCSRGYGWAELAKRWDSIYDNAMKGLN